MTDDVDARLNELAREGWVAEVGLRLVEAGPDRVVGEYEITPKHHQAYGIAHGGVHASVVETLASMAAAVWAEPLGLSVVGLENSTSFLRAVRSGTLRATATPRARGRTTQVWEVAIDDEQGRPVAVGRVRLLCLDPARSIDGSAVGDHRLGGGRAGE
ncbi:MAG: PaaI family thioesterase [Candidatus Dormibacteraeota bacterium]|nr:PaaI family thioesterase [Candidatus Dormibacteraeota bacterium]